MHSLSVLVLAGGHADRMRSSRPKPLHLLCGQAMVVYVVDAVADLEPDDVVVVVRDGREQVAKKFAEVRGAVAVDVVEQLERRGNGDAAARGLLALDARTIDDDEGDVLIVPGSAPLLRSETLIHLVEHHRRTGAAATLLTAQSAEPASGRRVVRNAKGLVSAVVTEFDAAPEQLLIDEVDTGIAVYNRALLAPSLRRVAPVTNHGEHRLSDTAAVLASTGHTVETFAITDGAEAERVLDRIQLAAAEKALRTRTNLAWMRSGVTMVDPDRTYIDATVVLGTDVTIFPGTLLQGRTVVGEGAEIGPDTRLIDCAVGARAVVEKVTARDAEIGPDAVVGPFAVLSPGAQIAASERTGPFYTATSTETS